MLNLLTLLACNPVWAMEPLTADRLMRAFLATGQAAPEAARKARTEPDEKPAPKAKPYAMVGNTAIIPMNGPMFKVDSWIAAFWGLTSTPTVTRAVTEATMDPAVQSIVLWMDSPGGATAGLADLADAVKSAASQKPVIAQVDGMAASAAYWVASQATRIHAGRMDMVGSIGTRMMLYDYSALFAKEGIEAVAIDTGEFKSAGAMGTRITEAHKAEFQKMVDALFAEFKQAVVSGRRMNPAQLDKLADGRVFGASEALQLGLIDAITPLNQTLASLNAQTGDLKKSKTPGFRMNAETEQTQRAAVARMMLAQVL